MSTTTISPETAPPTTGEVHRALAVRDERLRDAFDNLRGDDARDAIDRFIGPHRDADGRVYYLSDERVRTLVYRTCDRWRVRWRVDLSATMPYPVLPPALTMKTHLSLLFVPAWNALKGAGSGFPYSCWFMEPTRSLDEA